MNDLVNNYGKLIVIAGVVAGFYFLGTEVLAEVAVYALIGWLIAKVFIRTTNGPTKTNDSKEEKSE